MNSKNIPVSSVTISILQIKELRLRDLCKFVPHHRAGHALPSIPSSLFPKEIILRSQLRSSLKELPEVTDIKQFLAENLTSFISMPPFRV